MYRRRDELPRHITTESNKVSTVWVLMLILEVVIYGSFSILVNLSKIDDQILYKSGSVVLLIEFAKLMISAAMYSPEFIKRDYKLPHIPWTMLAQFAVPALLYTFNNNLAIYMQLQMDPTTFQVLNNLKIGTTALLYRLIIKRPISRAQWIALGLLTIAGVCDSYGGFRDRNVEGRSFEIYITISGLIMMLSYCTVSGFAAVYSEYILKKRIGMSLHLQNILLYVYGVIMNAGTMTWQSYSLDQKHDAFLKGFSVYTWLIVITQALNGLIMSVVMKHGSNLTRLFIISGGMLTSTMFSILQFGTQINVFFIVAASLVVLAIYLYHH